MAAITKSGVEVCVWIAKDPEGKYVSALKAAVSDLDFSGRIGHATLKVYPSEELKATYSSLMLGKEYIYISLWPSGFVKSFQNDVDAEGGRPNAIIRLNKLNISKILENFNKIINQQTWQLKSTKTTPLGKESESCSGFIYKLLQVGGIFENSNYGKGVARFQGPRTNFFYYKTNCHLGDIFNGAFNGAIWRAWCISPKLVLHVTAAAAESNPSDEQDTLTLMRSSDVHKDGNAPEISMAVIAAARKV